MALALSQTSPQPSSWHTASTVIWVHLGLLFETSLFDASLIFLGMAFLPFFPSILSSTGLTRRFLGFRPPLRVEHHFPFPCPPPFDPLGIFPPLGLGMAKNSILLLSFKMAWRRLTMMAAAWNIAGYP